MRKTFVQTANVSRTVIAVEALLASVRTSPGHGLMLVDGRTGTGKTVTMDHLAVHNRQAVYLRTHRRWTPPWMVEDISQALGLAAQGIMRTNIRRLIDYLKALGPDGQKLIILDEGDRVVRNTDLLETLRDLHDFDGTPFILVTEGRGREMVSRKSERTWRRVGQVVEFTPLTVADVQLMALELADLQISRPLAERLHQDSKGGSFGEVVVNLEKVEALVKANPGKEVGNLVDLALRQRAVG